ncbi:unnamed protein product [Didymodactylos carnosus]|uniref:Uncharacterized protein n=1 Tax=Didymodactylos carnosus TaxID=1234261 RepID=A0A8S2DJY4_9BILA|nr:unnamed protein product [Didymodactylos carnosus]CAF3693594.1 unnamed protein product [Didymodactylos carnosus]
MHSVQQQSSSALTKSEFTSTNQPLNTSSETEELIFLRLDNYVAYENRDKYIKLADPSQWKFYNDSSKCATFIRSSECQGKHVFLISSGTLGRELVPTVHNLPQFTAAYIHCSDVDLHKVWSGQLKKVKIVSFDDNKELFAQLFEDVMQVYVDIGQKYIQEGKRAAASNIYTEAMLKYADEYGNNDPNYIAFAAILMKKMDDKNKK